MSSQIIGKPLQKDSSLADRVSCQNVHMSNNVLISDHATEPKNVKIESANMLRELSLGTLSQIVKSLALSAAFSLGASFSDLLLSWVTSKDDNFSTIDQNTCSVSSDACLSVKGREHESMYSGASGETVDSLDVAIRIAADKRIKKAIDYAIARNVITSSPRDVACFFQSNREEIAAADLGNYISEEGVADAKDSNDSDDSHTHRQAWFTEIENNSVSSDESKCAALKNVHARICSLQISLTDDRNSRVSMESALQESDTGTFPFDVPSRTFLRSGDLHKRSPRTGRSSQFRLYLFSDVLLDSVSQHAMGDTGFMRNCHCIYLKLLTGSHRLITSEMYFSRCITPVRSRREEIMGNRYQGGNKARSRKEVHNRSSSSLASYSLA